MFLPIHFKNTLHHDLIYRYLTEDFKVNIFLDTNVFLWSLNINNKAFEELFRFLGNKALEQKLVIPNWAVFEFENQIRENKLDFRNFKNISKRLNSDLNSFEEYLKFVVDDDLAKHFSKENKVKLLEDFVDAKKTLESLSKISTHKGTINAEERIVLFKQFIRENPSEVNLARIIEKVNEVWRFRYNNKIPPGFKDENKNENKQGDLILWFELLEQSKLNKKNIGILISNDNKSDWCSRYKLEKGGVLIDAHPFLKHEFSNEVEKGEFYIVNLKDLVDILFSIEHDDGGFENYKNLSDALGISLGKSDTEKIIEWIIRDEKIYNEIVKDIAYWQHSPDEIEMDSLINYIVEKVPFKVIKEKVNWTDIMVNLIM